MPIITETNFQVPDNIQIAMHTASHLILTSPMS
jgi:hypothetical protein